MKKLVIGLLMLAVAGAASADTWYVGGVLFGNVCRAGAYYTVYPIGAGQPVGSSCPVRNNYGAIIGWGVVSAE